MQMKTYDVTQTVKVFTMITAPSEEDALKLFHCHVAALGDASAIQNVITDLKLGMTLDHASIIVDARPLVAELEQ